jgi:hypothetical protein
MKVLSLNVEYLTLSREGIMVRKLRLPGQQIRASWIVEAWDTDEASKFAVLPAHLSTVVEKVFSRTLWHPTARMRLIQFLFHTSGVKAGAAAFKARQPS